MGISPYFCLSKNTFISLQKYLHLSPVKHILLIEKYCRKQFWNCHPRLTCKNQTKRERNYYPFRPTNICLIYICTHECYSMWLHTTSLGVSTCADVRGTQTSTERLRCVLTAPLPRPLHRWDKHRESSVGWAPGAPEPAARLPAPATLPCLIYKPRSAFDGFLIACGDFLAHDLHGMDGCLTTGCLSSRWVL